MSGYRLKSARLVVEIRCGTEVVGLCVLESSPGWLHRCHWPPIVLGKLREGIPVTIAVVSTAMGVSPCFGRCEDKLVVCARWRC